jgi:hypothetical protein
MKFRPRGPIEASLEPQCFAFVDTKAPRGRKLHERGRL